MTIEAGAQESGPAFNPWILVMLGFTALAVSFSVRAMLGLVMHALEGELGWSRSFLSGVGALALVLMAFAAPFAGRIIDVSGPRSLMYAGMVAIGAGVLALTDSAAGFVSGFGIVVAGGHALFGGLLYDTTGAYGWLWMGSLALSVLAALLVFTLQDKPNETSARALPEGAMR
ncbi:hypothetical protein [Pannonibacter sp.]|uniref:hypothetical protein n=1 Tax=Pannonibacter sp. TaxID=1906786 RepID=UPI003F71E495